ncbi:hypothetical protein acdb102_13860 [Acidothermaceae bacterium B102]|nr:hypothetical protein acdb102_13860 [Acidothermaceae bacterium B102]
MAPIRQAARVVLVDDEGRVLLLWHLGDLDDHHWAPPGGGIEPGETVLEAAARELWEEVGFTDVVLSRPVWTWQHDFRYHGEQITQHETIFICRVPHREPRGQAENLVLDSIAEWRWWHPEDLHAVTEDVWPHGLATLLPAVLQESLDPAEPRSLNA